MVLTNLKRSRRELLRLVPGHVHSNGLPVSFRNVSINFCVDHAHPTLVAGHPFKGSWVSSSGFLLHPEMKRFQINTPILFAPPNPLKVVGATPS